jgi:hypothetical protein
MMYALIAVGIDGAATLMSHHADGEHADVFEEYDVERREGDPPVGKQTGKSAWQLEYEAVGCSWAPEDLGLRAPRDVGLWVWQGVVVPAPEDESEWKGSWRKATLTEVGRFVTGQLVFGSYVTIGLGTMGAAGGERKELE